MPQNFEHQSLTWYIGSPEQANAMAKLPMFRPFAPETVSFLSDLSERLLRRGRIDSAVTAFAFWCRNASLMQMAKEYPEREMRLGRGTVFHSAPSNVPVNFAFSFAAGVLAGNANIVRLPGKPFPQTELIVQEIAALLQEKHPELAPYTAFVKFLPDRALYDAFSAIASMRIIWGGDRTIAEWRKSPLPPRSGEIAFSDRFSFAVLDADAYCAEENKNRVIQSFWNDTYLSDQNACSSPCLVVWMGEKKNAAKADFWGRLHQKAAAEYVLSPVQCTGKWNAFCRAAIRHDLRLEPAPDLLITRLKTTELTETLLQEKYHSGFFLEYDAESLDELQGMCGIRCQTMAVFGIPAERVRQWIQSARPAGIDRVVPLGHTLDFRLNWDGHDLIRELSRKIDL